MPLYEYFCFAVGFRVKKKNNTRGVKVKFKHFRFSAKLLVSLKKKKILKKKPFWGKGGTNLDVNSSALYVKNNLVTLPIHYY